MKHVPALAAMLFAIGSLTEASTAYGTLNNFDVVNDTGQVCHGFEIELEDVHSTAVTYTYDWNHYGAPKIREDSSTPGHPKVSIRYESGKNASGEFLAFTAMPTRTLLPTDGHQCTNPSVNEGCEHFGVGFAANPTAVRYYWLVDDGAGNLVRGPAVNVATPVWTYVPADAGVPAQVKAVIEAPEPPEVIVKEFGEATWVKAITTTTHNPETVELEDLVSDDPNQANEKNWRNGEPDEIEVEWYLLQEEFSKPGQGNARLEGADDIGDPDETVTRRYEFFKYAGPHDPETYEASCNPYPDPNPVTPECETELLGDYIGAQMAGFNVAAVLGLIDHVENGMLDEAYTDRTLVVGGNTPYVTTVDAGALPAGLVIDSATGVLSGTPTAFGTFLFTLRAEDADHVVVSKAYTVVIGGGPEILPSNLLISKVKAAAVAAPGATFPVTLTTSNVSTVDARASRSGVWRSVNKTFGDDVLVGERAVSPINPTSVDTGVATITLPAVAPGIYYLIAQGDVGGDVPETDENDNTLAKKIAIGPDLVATMVLSPSVPSSGAPTTVTVTAKNSGGATAAASVTRLYRSVNGTIDASDVLLGELPAGSLAPKGTRAAAFTVTLPAGTYYLLAQADAAAAVAEASEVNNMKKVKLTVP